MPTWTVQIEAANASGEIWQALHPAETMQEEATAQEVAEMVVQNQTIVDPHDSGLWRVLVWAGSDPTGQPTYVHLVEPVESD